MFRFNSKKDLNSELIKCTIRLLDDNEVLEYEFNKEHNGQYLLDLCYKNLNINEKDYFGLRYVDHHKQRNWLDPTRPIYKQVKGVSPIVFCFRIKFYPIDVSLLKEENTRYHLYLQLRRDLLHGRLYCASTDLAYLMACVLQSELGDYDASQHGPNYIVELKLTLNQTSKQLLDEARRLHQTELVGHTPPEAEMLFLKKACQMETYGVDPHQVKDHKENQLYIGINHTGMMTFQGNRKTHHFKWNEIRKVTYEGRVFIVNLIINEKKNYVGFKCPSVPACHYLWRCAVEQRYFFTMNSSNEVPLRTTCGGFFTKRSTLHYSGRVQRDIINDIRKQTLIKTDERATTGTMNSNIVQRSASTCSAPGTMRTLGRSNTIHFGYTEQPSPTRELKDRQIPEDEMLEEDEYETGDLRNITPNSYNNFGSNIIHRHTSGTILHNGKYSAPMRSQSAAAAPSNFSNHRLSAFNEKNWDFSFTTEFSCKPDITPDEDEKTQHQNLLDHEKLRQKLGSHNIQNPDLLLLEKPTIKPSPSHHRNSELDLPNLEDKTDYDPIPNEEEEDQFNVNEQLPEFKNISTANNNTSSSSNHLLKQRSDSSTRPKLIRQKATTNDYYNQQSKQPSKLRNFCLVLRTSLISTILMCFLLALLMMVIFEVDSEFLEKHRQTNELLILREQLYDPIKGSILQYLNLFKQSTAEPTSDV